MHRIAVIGSGIAGLAAASRLAAAPGGPAVTLLEAGGHFGGHANTVDLTLGGVSQGVDTGFLVFNHRTYPLLTRLFEQLQVPTAAAEMSFSVQVPEENDISAAADRKSTRLNSSHSQISYAVFCLKKKTTT